MSLKDPSQKMSKSAPNTASRILINDSEDEIRSKITASLTDSATDTITYEPATRPGIANLIDILRHTTRTSSQPEDIAAEFNQLQGIKIKALKGSVADAIVKELEPARERYNALMAQDAEGKGGLKVPLEMGKTKAKRSAAATMQAVRRVVGLPSPSY